MVLVFCICTLSLFCEEKKVVKKRLKKKRGDAEHHTACRLLRDSTQSVLHNAARQCTLPHDCDLVPSSPQSLYHMICATPQLQYI